MPDSCSTMAGATTTSTPPVTTSESACKRFYMDLVCTSMQDAQFLLALLMDTFTKSQLVCLDGIVNVTSGCPAEIGSVLFVV